MALGEPTKVPVAQQHRTRGNPLRFEKTVDDIIEIPRTARDVEDWVRLSASCAALERAVERRHAGEWQSGQRILEQYHACRAEEARDLRLEHGVVHVAHHAEGRRGRRR